MSNHCTNRAFVWMGNPDGTGLGRKVCAECAPFWFPAWPGTSSPAYVVREMVLGDEKCGCFDTYGHCKAPHSRPRNPK